jgi:hypothetical protein
MSPDLKEIFQLISSAAFSLILLLVPILVRYYGPQVKKWILARVAEAQANMSAAQWALVQAAADFAVKKIEQLRKAGLLPNNKEALAEACKVAEAWLSSRGLEIDLDLLVSAVEAAVNDMNAARDK